MSAETATARTMGCAACGARFPIAKPDAVVVCPFCEQHQAMPEELLRELGGFRQQFSVEQAQGDEAAQHAEGWRELARASRPLGKYTVFFLQAAIAGPIALGVLVGKVFPDARLAPLFVIIAGYGLVLGVLLLIGRSQSTRKQQPARRREPARANLGIHQLSCPACAAPNPYDPRRDNTTCAHCNGALFPSGGVLRQSLDAARLGRRNAQLEKYRAERAGMTQLALGFRAGRSGAFARHKAAIITSLASAALLLTAPLQKEEVPMPVLLALGVMVPVPLVYAWRREQRERGLRARLEATLELVARQNRGVVDDELAEYLTWLDRHWAGPYDVPYDNLGTWFHSVRGTAGSYPSLIEMNLDPRDAAGGRVRALLAAWVPGVSGEEGPRREGGLPASARPFFDRLLELGWSVEVTPAGLVARMDVHSGGARALLREPESATGLTSALAHLAGLGRCLGAV